MNQFVLAGIAGIVVAAGAFTAGWRANSWKNDSEDLAIERAAQKAADSATGAAVTAIQGIGKIYVPIKQKAEVVTRTDTVYLPGNCDHSASGLQLVNQALTGGQPGSGTAGVPDLGSPE